MPERKQKENSRTAKSWSISPLPCIAVRHRLETAGRVLTAKTYTTPLDCMTYEAVSGHCLEELGGVQGLTCERQIYAPGRIRILVAGLILLCLRVMAVIDMRKYGLGERLKHKLAGLRTRASMDRCMYCTICCEGQKQCSLNGRDMGKSSAGLGFDSTMPGANRGMSRTTFIFWA